MKLADLGEFGLIARFAQALEPTLDQARPAGTVGIGDDCAVIPLTGDRSLLVTTDLLVEGVHFLNSTTTAYHLGHKSLAVNLSDIAAMGGRARSAFLSLALPADTEISWLDDFFCGLKDLAQKFGVAVLGGDTALSLGGITINITVLGEAAPAQIKLRSSAQAGDLIGVVGNLGDSAAGLRLLSSSSSFDGGYETLVRRHIHPEPLLHQGEFLAAVNGVHAMMDVSDGLDSDLRQIMARSNCGAAVELEKIQLSPELRNGAKNHGWNAHELACTGGEDYALLFTLAPDARAAVTRSFQEKFDDEISIIGLITDRPGELTYSRNEKPYMLKTKGFRHFKKVPG